MVKFLHDSIHPPQMEINAPKTVRGCPPGGIRNNGHTCKPLMPMDETEAPMISNSTSFPESLVVGKSTVRFSHSAKKEIGVTLDMHVTVAVYVVNMVRTANFEQRRIC